MNYLESLKEDLAEKSNTNWWLRWSVRMWKV